MFVAKIKHPAGDIAQLLVVNGLARCVDWMSPLLGGEGMQKLRDAERYGFPPSHWCRIKYITYYKTSKSAEIEFMERPCS